MRTLITKQNLALIIIILIAGFFRFFKLSEYPIQLNHDEISQLYDVGSIVQTKKDIYGNFLPLAFPSTGDYKVGHYIYISTIPYFIFGGQEITIRIPAAFFGTLTVLAVFLFVKVLTNNWLIAALSAGLVAILPSEIFYSRKSFENVIGVCLDFFGLYFLIASLRKVKPKIYGFIGMFLLVLAMYIYTSQTIIVPLLILLSFIVFWKDINKKRYLVSLTVAGLISAIPLMLLTFSVSGLRFRATSVFVSQDINLGRIINLNHNSIKSYVDFIFLKFLNQFDPIYLFVNGLDFTNQQIFGIGPLYIWQFPLVILGIIFLIKNKLFIKSRNLLFWMVILSIIPSAITFENYSPHRAMLAFTTLSIISAFGLYWLIEIIKKIEAKKSRLLILIFLVFTLLLNLAYFLRMYIGSYPFEKSQKMQYPFKQVAQYAWLEYNNFDRIVFDPKFGQTAPIIGVGAHYYFAYYGNFPPERFQREYRTDDKKREIDFDKFSIRQVYWPVDKDLKSTLVIVSSWSVPEGDVDKNKIVKRFYFYDGQLAFYAIKL